MVKLSSCLVRVSQLAVVVAVQLFCADPVAVMAFVCEGGLVAQNVSKSGADSWCGFWLIFNRAISELFALLTLRVLVITGVWVAFIDAKSI